MSIAHIVFLAFFSSISSFFI